MNNFRRSTLYPALGAMTIPLPVGIWLAFGVGIGMIETALLLGILGVRRKVKSDRL